mmetsp:Transcript_68841/g.193076  ORF Transcript_68841/g.193076 Transcript_68841/m.193076 type:complete len:301 (+) Transcript_68841:60-962(+)
MESILLPPCAPKGHDDGACGSLGVCTDEDAATESPASSVATEVMGSGWQPPGSAARAVVIFDWDDTLMCTSASQAAARDSTELERLAEAAEATLIAASRVAETFIVTNGIETWVRDSAELYMPRLLPLLEGLRVVSARALFERQFPGDPVMWKKAAFRELLAEEPCFAHLPGLNLVAIGDQMPELRAAHATARLVGPPSIAKTVKLIDEPSIADMIGQLRCIERSLPDLMADGMSGRRSTFRLPQLARDDDPSGGWRLSRRRPCFRESALRWARHARSALKAVARTSPAWEAPAVFGISH